MTGKSRITAAVAFGTMLSACGGKTERDFGGSATGDSRGSRGSYSDASAAAGGGTGDLESAGGDANAGGVPPPPETCRGPGVALCDTECVSLLTHYLHCGTCGNACPPGHTCNNGECICGPAWVDCDGECIDVSTDANNCGACGVWCCAGATCSEGQCSSSCPVGMTLCRVPGVWKSRHPLAAEKNQVSVSL